MTSFFRPRWLCAFIASMGTSIVLITSPSFSSNTLAEVPTRFGMVTIVKNSCEENGFCFGATATLGSKAIDVVVNSANEVYINVLAIFPTSDGDLIILAIPPTRAIPNDFLIALLARNSNSLDVISNDDFFSADWSPFRMESEDGRFTFDLGFQDKKHKTAIYDQGKLTITFSGSEQMTLPKSDCAFLLNSVKDCLSLKDCSNEAISDNFLYPRPFAQHLAALENKPGFHTEDLSNQCQRTCITRKYDLRETRKRLCGY